MSAPSPTARPCHHCKGTGWDDPIGILAGRLDREAAFKAAHPRIYCPHCRKRCSPWGDNVNAFTDDPLVIMVCHHCHHRWEIER